MKYDATIKELFSEMPALFQLLTGSCVTQLINLEFSTVQQRRADLVAWLANQEILHLELQSDNDNQMLWRELEYGLLILKKYDKMPIQVVLYLGKESSNFITKIHYPNLQFSYQLVDIKEVNSEHLLESEAIGDNLLALLGKLEDKRSAVRRVIKKIAQLNNNKRADVLEKLAILSGLRPLELPDLIQEEAREMSITIDLEENPLFADIFKRREQRGLELGEKRGLELGEKRGLQLGKKQGEIMLLHRQLEKRFGILPNWVDLQLEQADSSQLAIWSLQLLDAQNLEEIFK